MPVFTIELPESQVFSFLGVQKYQKKVVGQKKSCTFAVHFEETIVIIKE